MSKLDIFAIKVDDNKDAIYCAEQASKRASGPGLHEFFAKWVIFEHEKKDNKRTYVVAVYSKFPEAWKIGATMLGLPLVITGLLYTYWMIPGLIVFGSSFLASVTFRFWTFKMSLRRYGYKGKITKVDNDEIILKMLEARQKKWLKAI